MADGHQNRQQHIMAHQFSYDRLLTSMGGFGRYQAKLCFLVSVAAMCLSSNIYSVIFTTMDPRFRCAVPALDNDTFHIQNEAHQLQVNASVPFDMTTSQYSQCEVYAQQLWSDAHSQKGLSDIDRNTTTACNRWVYDPDSSTSSLTIDMDLVCHRKSYTAHFQMVVMLGLLVGSFCGGTVADYIGRKKLMIFAAVAQSLCGTGQAFVNNVQTFLVIRFLITVLGITMFLAGYVLVAEVVGAKYRTRACLSGFLGTASGQFYCLLIYYLIRDWRTAQLVVSMPFVAVVSYYWLLDESPRWLIVHKRTEEAQKVLLHMSKTNKSMMPEQFELAPAMVINAESVQTTHKQVHIGYVFTSRVLLKRIAILAYSWSTLSVVYYGLAFNMRNLIKGDYFVNFCGQATTELLSAALSMLCLERVGRKKIFCGSLMIGGVACLATAGTVISDAKIQWLSLVLYAIGKLGITTAFLTVYVISAELLPTVVRNSGIGFCSSVARIASLSSPYINMLGFLISKEYGNAFTFSICGISSIIAAIMGLILPETRNRKLPDTIEDAKNIIKIRTATSKEIQVDVRHSLVNSECENESTFVMSDESTSAMPSLDNEDLRERINQSQ